MYDLRSLGPDPGTGLTLFCFVRNYLAPIDSMFLVIKYDRHGQCYRVTLGFQVEFIERMKKTAFILRIPTRYICSRMQSTSSEYMDCSLTIWWMAWQAYINHHPDLYTTFVNPTISHPSYMVQYIHLHHHHVIGLSYPNPPLEPQFSQPDALQSISARARRISTRYMEGTRP
jgi:hypothetical protein